MLQIHRFRLVRVQAQVNLSITNITQSANSLPNYEKFEVTFDVNDSVAQNPQWPCDTSQSTPTSGAYALPTVVGISVDGLFLPPGQSNWSNALRQPAFLYTPHDYRVVNADGALAETVQNVLEILRKEGYNL